MRIIFEWKFFIEVYLNDEICYRADDSDDTIQWTESYK